MNVAVVGLWHLGSVTAACCAPHFSVVGLDFDGDRIESLRLGKAPIAEPGLDDLLRMGLKTGSLTFTCDVAEACRDADVVWVCYDTPVDDDDRADVDFVMERVRRCLPHLKEGAVLLLSSQVPVGTCETLRKEIGSRSFSVAYSPENLRLGRAIEVFQHPERIIVGVNGEGGKERLARLFGPFSDQVLWMTAESAEMTKHAINAFLATSITFANELARLCELCGADAKEVERGLKSEARIGDKAYVGPGGAIGGGTLLRDVRFLVDLAHAAHEPLSVLPGCIESNRRHELWPLRTLETAVAALPEATVALLGLTYKPDTDTLRRSPGVALCGALLGRGCQVKTFDPAVSTLPADLKAATICDSLDHAVEGADAAVVCTPWPQFRAANWSVIIPTMRRALIVDANRFLLDVVIGIGGLEYRAVGMPA
jgi:UDPglucose 6-dehydrogenase